MGRYDKVAARTDNDITDDETGQARIVMAAASKARRQAEAADLRRQNAEMKKRLKNVEASTDDQLDTERAALARAEMAAASKARIAAENAARRRHAREMEERIRSTPTFYQLRCHLSHYQTSPPTHHTRKWKICRQVQENNIEMMQLYVQSV